MIYQVKSRVKIAILIFFIALILAGVGVYFYIFKYKEPTNGVFVDNNVHETREELACGYLCKPSKEDNSYQKKTNPTQRHCRNKCTRAC